MCLEQCCPWLLGLGMMVAGQAGRTLRTDSLQPLSARSPVSTARHSQHQDIHWGLNVHVYVHSKGAEGLKRVHMKRIL